MNKMLPSCSSWEILFILSAQQSLNGQRPDGFRCALPILHWVVWWAFIQSSVDTIGYETVKQRGLNILATMREIA
jgi:hypothetical protein